MEDTETKNTITVAIIHRLIKERQGIAEVVTRSSLLPLTSPVTKLVDDIYNLYGSRTGKGYGRFEADEASFPTARILRETYLDKKKDFFEASKELMMVLAAKAGYAQLATGGYVLMAQGHNSAKGLWFIAAIITNVEGSAIREDSLEIVDTVHIDLTNVRVAGRVGLTDWLAKKDVRYIGFLKQRGEVSDYFKFFLGCNEFVAAREETKKLVAVLKNFAKTSGLDDEKQQTFLKSVHDYCEECGKNEQPLSLEALSNRVWPNNPVALQTALTAPDVEISDGFVPDRRSLRGFIKIKAKTKYWSVELDRMAIVNGEAKYNPKERTLTFTKLPKALEDELTTELSDG